MQERKKNIVIFTYIGIFSLVIPAIFWFSGSSQKPNNTAVSYRNPPLPLSPNQSTQSSPPKSPGTNISQRISFGGKMLIPAVQNSYKQAAVEAFAAGDYSDAIVKYDASLQIKPNDPEALIYKNNAMAIASGEFLTIAVSVPIGGNLNVAKEMLRGVAHAQQEVNDNGGINGKYLQVSIANDDNDPEIVEQIATKFSQDEQILGVVGHNSTEASVTAAAIYQQAGLVMISPTTVGNSLSNAGSYIFRTTPDTRSTADVLARYTVDSTRKRKIAICSASDAKASQSFKDGFEWSIFQAGGRVIETNCDFSRPDFNPSEITAQAISSGADALLLNPSIYNVNSAIDVIQANKQKLPLLANQTMYIYETLQQGSSDANGMTLSVAWHPVTSSDKSFIQDAKMLWGGPVGWRTAMAYDATKAMVIGLETGATRQQIQDTLADPDFAFSGATGIVRFLPSGDRNLKGAIVKVESGDLSGVGYDFVPLEPE